MSSEWIGDRLWSSALIHWLCVNSCTFAGPPKRPPLSDAPMPPDGTWNLVFTVLSLMCTMPLCRRWATVQWRAPRTCCGSR